MDLRELRELDHEDVERPWVAAPPPASLVVGLHEDRPIQALREVASDPLRALRASAAAWNRNRPYATALAEMAVTGRGSKRQYVAARPLGGDLAKNDTGAHVIAYAEQVLTYLDSSGPSRVELAVALAHEKRLAIDPRFDAPWLAVVGELDAPHRPVNVGVTRHAQHDADVVMIGRNAITVSARYATIGDLESPRGVILLLHGLGSRLEEVDVVAEELAARGYGVVAVDLPSQGYSSRIAPTDIGDPAGGTYRMPVWDRDEGFTYLAFSETFVAAFADAIGIRDRIVAVGGGSLGGTLALRLAIHGALGPRVRSIAWSPGSVWGTQQTNYVNWAAIEATAGRRLYRAESFAEDDDEPSSYDSRTDYIRWVFDAALPLVKAQPTLWFKGMPLEAEHTAAARADRRELYDHAHRITCLALAYEQTIYSITETPHGHHAPRFARIGAPLLMMAGSRDDDLLDIHREVGKLAARMKSHGRTGRVVRLDACHSIHDERPRTLAREIDAFLRDEPL